jgi:hypothetical protein
MRQCLFITNDDLLRFVVEEPNFASCEYRLYNAIFTKTVKKSGALENGKMAVQQEKIELRQFSRANDQS